MNNLRVSPRVNQVYCLAENQVLNHQASLLCTLLYNRLKRLAVSLQASHQVNRLWRPAPILPPGPLRNLPHNRRLFQACHLVHSPLVFHQADRRCCRLCNQLASHHGSHRLSRRVSQVLSPALVLQRSLRSRRATSPLDSHLCNQLLSRRGNQRLNRALSLAFVLRRSLRNNRREFRAHYRPPDQTRNLLYCHRVCLQLDHQVNHLAGRVCSLLYARRLSPLLSHRIDRAANRPQVPVDSRRISLQISRLAFPPISPARIPLACLLVSLHPSRQCSQRGYLPLVPHLNPACSLQRNRLPTLPVTRAHSQHVSRLSRLVHNQLVNPPCSLHRNLVGVRRNNRPRNLADSLSADLLPSLPTNPQRNPVANPQLLHRDHLQLYQPCLQHEQNVFVWEFLFNLMEWIRPQCKVQT